jgi:hypothetical protein
MSCCHTVAASMLCFVQGIVCRQKQAFGHPHCSTVSREGVAAPILAVTQPPPSGYPSGAAPCGLLKALGIAL